MTKRKRRNHSPSFKAKVAMAALRGDKTLAEIAQQYDVHPNQIQDWKKRWTKEAEHVFENGNAHGDSVFEQEIEKLRAKIGAQPRPGNENHQGLHYSHFPPESTATPLI